MLFDYIKKKSVSISIKMTLIFSLLSSLFLLIALTATYIYISYNFETANRSEIENKFQMLSAIYSNRGLHGLDDFFSVEKNKISNSKIIVCVRGPREEIFYYKPSNDEEAASRDEFLKKVNENQIQNGWISLQTSGDEDRIDVYRNQIDKGIELLVAKSSDDADIILDRILSIFITILILFIFLSFVVGIFYSNKFLQPIRKLNKTISEIEKSGLSHRVELGMARDELRFLGEAFNRMIDKIEKLVVMMTESLDHVAHDIRTPLTKIVMVSENAITSQNSELMRDALSETMLGANQIAELVSQLLSISEAEAGILKLKYENCDVQRIIQQVIEVYEFIANEKEIQINFKNKYDEKIFWNFDRKRTQQAIANLVDNAIKYSPNNSRVEIFLEVKENELIIGVSDEGCGVSEEDFSKIWERLYRGDKSRSQYGLGLGLAIVKANILAHSGRVKAERLKIGMKFMIQLPQKSLG